MRNVKKKSIGSTLIVFVVLLAAAGGCRTAERAVNRGESLAAEGRFEEAFEEFYSAVQKNPEIDGGIEGLRSAGNSAVQQLLDFSTDAAENGSLEDAASAYVTIDAISVKAQEWGVSLDLPSDYRTSRRMIFDRAIDHAIEISKYDIENLQWSDAVAKLDLVLNFEPTGEQQREIAEVKTRALTDWSSSLQSKGAAFESERKWDSALEAYDSALEVAPNDSFADILDGDRVRVLLKWGEDDLRYGRFRGAYDRAMAALEIRPRLESAAGIADEAIRRGTVLLAPIPIWRTASAGAGMPVDFLIRLNEELQYGYWDAPPLFIATPDPRDVRNYMRDENLQDRILSDSPVYRLGRELDAHLVLYGEITRYAGTEELDKEDEKTARMRNGDSARYLERRMRLDVQTMISFRIVDPARERVVYSGNVEARESTRYSVAVYSGNEMDLELNRSERSIFSGEQKRDRTNDLEQKLVEELSKKLADRVFEEISRTII